MNMRKHYHMPSFSSTVEAFSPIGDKVAEAATGPKQSQRVAIKLPPTSPKYSSKPVRSPHDADTEISWGQQPLLVTLPGLVVQAESQEPQGVLERLASSLILTIRMIDWLSLEQFITNITNART